MSDSLKCIAKINHSISLDLVSAFSGKHEKRYPKGSSDADKTIYDDYLDSSVPMMEFGILKDIAAVDDGLLFRRLRLCGECTPYYFERNHPQMRVAKRETLGAALKQLKRYVRILLPSRNEYFNERFYWCSDLYSRAYYHWVAETLPRIFLLLQIVPDDCKIALPGRLQKYNYITESLALFPQASFTFLSRSLVSRFVELGWISQMGKPYQFNPPLMRLLREYILQASGNDSANGQRRIYITRREAAQRRIVNEVEIIDILEEFGFEIVVAERLSFHEQVKLFSEAGILIGLHGAGLANMLFMPAKATILEIRKKSSHSSCFFRMAHALELDYDYLLGDCHPEDVSRNEIFVDVKVDAKELREKITAMKIAN